LGALLLKTFLIQRDKLEIFNKNLMFTIEIKGTVREKIAQVLFKRSSHPIVHPIFVPSAKNN
jgi:hypothetical protein